MVRGSRMNPWARRVGAPCYGRVSQLVVIPSEVRSFPRMFAISEHERSLAIEFFFKSASLPSDLATQSRLSGSKKIFETGFFLLRTWGKWQCMASRRNRSPEP